MPETGLYHYIFRLSQPATILWGGPPGPRPTPWSACSDAARAGPGGPARTGASAPRFGCGEAAKWGRMESCWPIVNRPSCSGVQTHGKALP
jgi:hypothetical protein